jgi:hypothetical protein
LQTVDSFLELAVAVEVLALLGNSLPIALVPF